MTIFNEIKLKFAWIFFKLAVFKVFTWKILLVVVVFRLMDFLGAEKAGQWYTRSFEKITDL